MARSPRSSDIWPTPRRPWDAGLRDRIGVVRDSVAFVSKRLAGTLLVWLLIGIALALPAALHLLDRNLAGAAGDWRGTHGFSVYFQVGVDAQVPAEFARRLADDTDINTVRLITPDDALAELRLHLGGNRRAGGAWRQSAACDRARRGQAGRAGDAPRTLGDAAEGASGRGRGGGGKGVAGAAGRHPHAGAARRRHGGGSARRGRRAHLFGDRAPGRSGAADRIAGARLGGRQRALHAAAVLVPWRDLRVRRWCRGGHAAGRGLGLAGGAVAALVRQLRRGGGGGGGFDGAFVLALLGIGVVLGAFGAVLACRARLRELDLA